MTRRFSSQDLEFLRNRVPIDHVIESLSGSAIQNSNGKRLIACPICGGLDTSIHAAHNLIRCFACPRNFNPIELVMHQMNIGFVDSVKWLQNRMPPAHQHSPPNKIGNAQPCSISNILSHVMPSAPQSKTGDPCLKSIAEKISRLENRIEHIDRLVNDLQSRLDQ